MTGTAAPIPGRAARWILAGLFLVELEYVLWPSPVTGTAGSGFWSVTGNALLVALALALFLGVALPLRRRLRTTDADRGSGIAVAMLAASFVLVWMWLTSELSVAPGDPVAPGGTVSVSLASPFGFLPSTLFRWPGAGLQGYLSPLLVLLGIMGYIWAAAAVLAFRGANGRALARPDSASGRRAGTIGAFSWAPGLVVSMSCCSTPPLLALLLLGGGPQGWAWAYGNLAPVLNGLSILAAWLTVAASSYLGTRPPAGDRDRTSRTSMPRGTAA